MPDKFKEQCGNCKYSTDKEKGKKPLTCRYFPIFVGKLKGDWCGQWSGKAGASIEAMNDNDAHNLVKFHAEVHKKEMGRAPRARHTSQIEFASQFLDMEDMDLEAAKSVVLRFFEVRPTFWFEKNLTLLKHILKSYEQGQLDVVVQPVVEQADFGSFLNDQYFIAGPRDDFPEYSEYAKEAWKKHGVRVTYNEWSDR